LLQVVLAGELALEEKLKRIQMRELQQRITVHCKTATLNRDETFDYVRNRLQVGGAKSQSLFQPDAMDSIYFHSRGIPRVINVLCEQALINACADQVHVVTPQFIQEVALAFQWEYPRHLPPTVSPASLAIVDSAPAPRIAAPELPFVANQEVLNKQPAVSPVSPTAEATETGSEILLKNRSRSPIPDSPTTPVQQSLENIALGTLPASGGEKWQSAELTNSSSRHLLTEFLQELETKINLGHALVQAKIRGRGTGQYTPPPLSMKVKNQRARLPSRAASPFWAWWFYGSRPGWWKNIAPFMNLPRWWQRCASLQRWL
jgi:hypothetical protein